MIQFFEKLWINIGKDRDIKFQSESCNKVFHRNKKWEMRNEQ